MTPLRAGDLRNQVAFRRLAEVEDGKGGYVPDWRPIATVAAEVTGLDGRESVMEHVLLGVSVYRLRIRWRDDLLPSDQARFGSIDLNIRSIADPDGRCRQLVIVADTAGARAED